MNINEQFWGGEEQSYEIIPGVKRTSYNMKDAFNQEESAGWTLPLNEKLDTSICPWAINNNADVAKIAYGISYRTDPDSLAYEDPKFYSIHDFEAEAAGGIPIYFATPYYAGNGGTQFNWFTRNGLAQANIYDPVNVTYGNYRTMIYPIREFDYSKFLFYVQLVYGNASDTDLGSPNVTTVDYYFNPSRTDAWRDEHPIVGINFIPYYRGWNTQQSNWWQQCPWNMNTMGLKKPCEVAPSGAGVGYNVDFIDDFMSLITAGSAIGAWRNNYGGTGRIRIYDGSSWAMNEEQCASIVLSTNYDTEPILHVPILNEESKWKTNSHWTGTQDVQFRTELDHTKFQSYDEMKEYILKQAAYLGTWFVTNTDTLTSNETVEPGSSDGWYLGEIGDGGVTTGNYKQGASTAELDNSTWTDAWEESGWNGRPEDPNKYDKDLNTQTISGLFMGGTNDYIMTPLTFVSFLSEVRTMYGNIMETAGWAPETAEAALLAAFGTTENPLSLIKVARQFPFDLGNLVSSDAAATIRIGNTDITAPLAPSPLPATYCEVRKVASYNWTQGSDYQERKNTFETDKINYFKQFNSFLDYEPYSCAELWVPWCGTVKIDPQIYCGHDIKIKYSVDIESGQIKGRVYRDQLQVDEIKGSVGTEIPLDYTSYGEILNAQIQAQATEQANKTKFAAAIGQVGMTIAGLGITAATMGLGAPVSAAATTALATASTAAQRSMAAARISDMTNAAQKANTTTTMGMGMQALGTAISTATSIASANNYHVNPGGVTFREIGSTNGGLSIIEYEPFLRLNTYRPKFLDNYTKKDFGLYGHQVGFACLKYDQLKNYSGLTCCGSVDLSGIKIERQGQISIVPTQEEIDIIRKSLQTGVYLP